MNSKKVAIWLPIIIASSIALGIFVGNVYKSRNLSGSKGIPSGEGKLDAILNIIDRQYVDTIDVNEIVEEAIPKIFSELDPHSAYIPAKDLQMVNEDLEGSFSGIGIQFNYQTDTVVVVSVITGGPSDKIGLLPGDRIISVNDSTIAGVKASTEKVMKMLRGPKDSIVKLGVQRNTSPDLISFEVTRGDIPVNSVDASFEVDKGIGYIKINKFGRNTYQEFITALAELKAKGCKSFVIDLRSNGGGYMDAAINMVNEFLPKDRLIVYTEGKSFPRRDVFSNGTGTAQEDQVVVLMDDFSASASEIFAGAIQDNDRGTIIGRRSFGKGLVQEQIPLSDGSAIRLTIARYFTPSGRSIQKEYQRGAGEEYEQELYNRFLHGEFDSKDSIKQNDSLRYETIGGRAVYGGGGIMPDVFIPRDTTGITSYYNSVMNSGLLFQFTFKYTDQNRAKLSSFKNYQELLDYLKSQPLLDEFTTFAAANGVRKRPYLINVSKNLIERQLYAYIIRNIFDDNGFFPVFLSDDPALKQGVKIIQENKAKPVAPVSKEQSFLNIPTQKGKVSIVFDHLLAQHV